MSLQAKYLTFYTLQREKAGQDMTPRQWFTEGYDAAMRHFYANETRQPDRRNPQIQLPPFDGVEEAQMARAE